MSEEDTDGDRTRWRTFVTNVNEVIANNDNLLEIYLVNQFRGNPIARDDWGANGIIEVNVVGNELIGNENYSRLRMRFNEKGDCVFIVFSIL